MVGSRCVQRIVNLCIVGLVATMLGSPAVADWRSVDDSGLAVEMDAPGLTTQARRDSAHVDDMQNGKSIRSCWGAPGKGVASACISYQAKLGATGRFPYLRATDIASMSGPLRPLAKDVARTNQTVATGNADYEVARFTTFSGGFQQSCFSLARYWDDQRRRIIGWYCAAAGVALDDNAARDIIATITSIYGESSFWTRSESNQCPVTAWVRARYTRLNVNDNRHRGFQNLERIAEPEKAGRRVVDMQITPPAFGSQAVAVLRLPKESD